MKSVLVTGATGFIGRQVLQPLRDRGYDVHAVHRRSPRIEIEGVNWHRVDLLEDKLPVRTSHLLHLAWFAVPGAFWDSPENLRWRDASLRLLRSFARAGGERVVVAGTCAEYDWSAGVCLEGQTPIEPRGLYGECKDELRKELETMHELSSAWGRIFFLYGPGEHPDRLVPSVARPLLRGEPTAVGGGAQIRDFLYVVDAGAALVALLNAEAVGPINIGSGRPIRIGEVVETVAKCVGRPDLVRPGMLQTYSHEAPVVLADVHRLSDEVGWRPSVSFVDGIAKTVEWWRMRT